MMSHHRHKRGIYWRQIKRTLAMRENEVNALLLLCSLGHESREFPRETLLEMRLEIQEARVRLARTLGK